MQIYFALNRLSTASRLASSHAAARGEATYPPPMVFKLLPQRWCDLSERAMKEALADQPAVVPAFCRAGARGPLVELARRPGMKEAPISPLRPALARAAIGHIIQPRKGLQMSYPLPPLNWIRAFEASARHSSFSAAARELNLTATAISYQVRSLEQHIGQPLFERRARSVRLTGLGATYLPDVRQALEQLAATTVKLFGLGAGSALTVRAPLSFVSLFLAPRLSGFQKLYPRLPIQLFSLLWADALADESTDIDIRFGSGNWPGYVAERLMHDHSVVVVQSDVVRAAKGRKSAIIETIANSPLIHVIGYEDHWAETFRILGLPAPAIQRSLRVDNSLAALTLVANGAGATIVLRSHAMTAAKFLPLDTPFEIMLPIKEAHYLLTPLDRKIAKPESLVFKSWLLEQVRGFEQA